MPRPRPPYLLRETTRHGKPVWYVRIGTGPRIRIKAEYGSPEFDAEYQAARQGERISKPVRSGSLEWLIERYREVDAWKSLAPATRKQREAILRHVIKAAGKEPFNQISQKIIAAGRDRRGNTPAQARHFVITMKGLFGWATDAGFIKTDPAANVKLPKERKTQGFPVWTEADIARYEAHWPLSTKERVWLAVLLYTGLRRGDAVRLGRQHVRAGIASIRTEKSQGDIEVAIPILPELQSILAAGPTGELAFICGVNGKPMTKESFGNAFHEACRAAGINKSAHGVRKAGATRAANNGATVAQLEAIFGWQGGGMASLYTRSADRARLAKEAIGKLRNKTEISIPAPDQKVRGAGRND